VSVKRVLQEEYLVLFPKGRERHIEDEVMHNNGREGRRETPRM